MFEQLLACRPELGESVDESALIDGIAWLEAIKAAAAAQQARLTVALDAARREAEAAAGVPAARRGRGIGAEVALARRDSPARGGRHLGFATALVHEMPHTLAALDCGALSEWRPPCWSANRRAWMLRTGPAWMPRCAPTPMHWTDLATPHQGVSSFCVGRPAMVVGYWSL